MPTPSETTAAAETSDGGPAFPQLAIEAMARDSHGDAIEPFTSSVGGMTLRQWYIGQALASVAASIMKAGSDSNVDPAKVSQTIASVCVELADAAIAAERAKAVRS